VHSLPWGALTTFPCKFGPKIVFSALGGTARALSVHPLATPMRAMLTTNQWSDYNCPGRQRQTKALTMEKQR